jgi:hypothetical protein
VRVLLDENIPHDFARELPGLDVSTVQGLGWSGLSNGELLRRATGRIDAFVTMDGNVEFQQDLASQSFATIVLCARSNRMAHLRPLIGALRIALSEMTAGQFRRVGGA